MGIYYGAYAIGAVFAIIGMIVSNRLQSKFKSYSKISLQNGLSGKEIAEQMLADNGINDVQVISTKGQLTDHYNPKKKTVNLSEVVYHQRNAAAAAVAAHEVGHAVQHSRSYRWLQFRSSLVPVVSFSSRFVHWILIGGVLLINVSPNFLLVGIALFAITTLFSLITLPVEFDASRRALIWLEESGNVTAQEHAGAKDALKWAARTYVVAAMASLATLLYYLAIYMRRR